MAQVQLATKIDYKTHLLLDEAKKISGDSKASITDKALREYIAKYYNIQYNIQKEVVHR